MPIPLKSPRDIAAMRSAGSLLWRILQDAKGRASPGVTTAQLDQWISSRILESRAEPIARGEGFPGAASITINEEVVHAPPGPRRLREGDVVTIDAALRLDGWCADAAITTTVGEPSPDIARLLRAASQAVLAAINEIRPGRRWSDAAAAATAAAHSAGCSVVHEYAGHGIGRSLQEPPAAPFSADYGGNTASACQDFVLRPGTVLTVEPVLVLGRPEVLGMDDAWTVVTADRSAAAHEERTVAVTRTGALVLTAP